MKLPIRYVARITLEAATPLAVGSGESSITCDSLVFKDTNNLPIIPGTALAGVLRHSVSEIIGEQTANSIFGYQAKRNEDEEHAQGEGSRLIVSSAHFWGKDGYVSEGLNEPDWTDYFYAKFHRLPVRQHVRISDKGAAVKGGKFDEEVVYKGTRFVCELELKGDENDNVNWGNLLHLFADKYFRIGGGTRKGFGELMVVSIINKKFNLKVDKERKEYSEKKSTLTQKFLGEEFKPVNTSEYTHYKLDLNPDNFFLFSSGFSSDSSDFNPVKEQVIDWENNVPTFSEEQVLIPATSVKGAISHRVAYHYNSICEVTMEQIEDDDKGNEQLDKRGYLKIVNSSYQNTLNNRIELATKYNPAVLSLFGVAANDSFIKEEKANQRGNVLFSDVFINTSKVKEKLLNHVSIDRFTGGAIDGALYSEVVTAIEKSFELNIFVSNTISDENVIKAFEKALADIIKGMLPLGGGTMRGHGCFKGRLIKNGKEIGNE